MRTQHPTPPAAVGRRGVGLSRLAAAAAGVPTVQGPKGPDPSAAGERPVPYSSRSGCSTKRAVPPKRLKATPCPSPQLGRALKSRHEHAPKNHPRRGQLSQPFLVQSPARRVGRPVILRCRGQNRAPPREKAVGNRAASARAAPMHQHRYPRGPCTSVAPTRYIAHGLRWFVWPYRERPRLRGACSVLRAH